MAHIEVIDGKAFFVADSKEEKDMGESERQAWIAEIIKYYEKGWYKLVLRLMAANVGDNGDVVKMIDGFCANADPAENWREVE